MRAFLGVSMPQELVQRILKVQEKLSDFDIKFVEKENLHFNIKFFRDIEEEKLSKLKEILKDVCSQFEKFDIKIVGIGTFPSKTYIRVIWIGVKDGYTNFVNLANLINDSLQSLGFEREERFIPHLTLGRVRSGRNKEKLIVLTRELENIEIGKMKVERIVLFQSKLSPKGPVYQEVFSIEL